MCAAITPSESLLDRLLYSPSESTEWKSVNVSSSSPASTPTLEQVFAKLKQQQRRCQNNITTYVAGELHLVDYPLTPGGMRVKPSLVWFVLKTYDMPQLYCFHEIKAVTHPVEQGLWYVAECGQKKAKCGYYVNLNLAHQNKDGPAKLYRQNQSVEVIGENFMNEDGPACDEFIAPDSNPFNISAPNVTPPSSGPVRTPKSRGTPWSTDRSKKACIAERMPLPHREFEFIPPAMLYALANSDPTSTPAPAVRQESMPRDYSQPPYTQEDSPDSTLYHTDLFRPFGEVMFDLESSQGLQKTLFWSYFKECEHCSYIARADVHICPIEEDPFDDADEVDSATIRRGYEADTETSPTASPVSGGGMLVGD